MGYSAVAFLGASILRCLLITLKLLQASVRLPSVPNVSAEGQFYFLSCFAEVAPVCSLFSIKPFVHRPNTEIITIPRNSASDNRNLSLRNRNLLRAEGRPLRQERRLIFAYSQLEAPLPQCFRCLMLCALLGKIEPSPSFVPALVTCPKTAFMTRLD